VNQSFDRARAAGTLLAKGWDRTCTAQHVFQCAAIKNKGDNRLLDPRCVAGNIGDEGVPLVAEADEVISADLSATPRSIAVAIEWLDQIAFGIVASDLFPWGEVAHGDHDVRSQPADARVARVIDETSCVPAKDVAAARVAVPISIDQGSNVRGEGVQVGRGEHSIESILGPDDGAPRDCGGGENSEADPRVGFANLCVRMDQLGRLEPRLRETVQGNRDLDESVPARTSPMWPDLRRREGPSHCIGDVYKN